MPVHNADIAELLERYASLLEIDGANPFRVRAYRSAAHTIRDLPESVDSLLARGASLEALPGIGADLATKIAAIARSGRFRELDEIEQRLPSSLVELAAIPGLGPKRVAALYRTLGIDSREKLAAAAAAGELHRLPGFGERTERHILKEISRGREGEGRVLLAYAEEVAEALVRHINAAPGVHRATVAGSYRRRKDTVGDLDILVACGDSGPVMDRFVGYDEVDEVVSKGDTRSTVILRSGLQVDLRVVDDACYGAALHYFTGSKAHNIAVRTIGVHRGLKINEYGIFKGEKRISGAREEDVFAAVGLPFIVPELRENRGEIEAAQEGRLPELVTLEDIRGDLHVHSKASDGKASIAEIAEAAKARGYDYVAITDHSQRVTIAHGLDPDRLARQIDEIDRINAELDGIVVLKGCEVDILEDGALDLPDSILARLDLTVCSVHSKFGLSREAQTARVLKAMDNPNFRIFGHPTGRLLGERPAYDIDIARIVEGARERGCILEINAQPQRLDLDDVHARMAKDAGVKLAISTDAHSVGGLDYMRFGIGQARRGWVEAVDVVNSRPLAELKRLLRRA